MKKLLSIVLVILLVFSLAPMVAAEDEPAYDEETGVTSISLFNCDQKPQGSNSLTVDKAEKTEGEASLSFNVGRGVVNEMPLPESVDGYGYDTLEFDLYVSSVELFNYFTVQGQMDSNLEITSSGKSDAQELAWTLGSIQGNNMGEAIVDGWNHIILPLSSAVETESVGDAPGAPFDISNINYMRFYMVGETADTGIVVKIDNFRLSDYNEVITAQRKEKADREAAKKVEDKINALEEVTAQNYETIKKSVEDARKAYNRLNDDAETYVSRTILKKLEAAEAKIAEYEANPPVDEPVEDPTDDPVDEPTDDPVDEPTTEQPEQTPEEQPEQKQEDSGCGASIALSSAVFAMAVLGLGVTVLKKEN